jgi:hypothetical protein
MSEYVVVAGEVRYKRWEALGANAWIREDGRF